MDELYMQHLEDLEEQNLQEYEFWLSEQEQGENND